MTFNSALDILNSITFSYMFQLELKNLRHEHVISHSRIPTDLEISKTYPKFKKENRHDLKTTAQSHSHPHFPKSSKNYYSASISLLPKSKGFFEEEIHHNNYHELGRVSNK